MIDEGKDEGVEGVVVVVVVKEGWWNEVAVVTICVIEDSLDEVVGSA